MRRLFFVIAILIVFTFVSCSVKHDDKQSVTFEVELITGTKKRLTYNLPNDVHFYIDTHRGSYRLKYSCHKHTFCNGFGNLRAGVVDFKVVKKTNL